MVFNRRLSKFNFIIVYSAILYLAGPSYCQKFLFVPPNEQKDRGVYLEEMPKDDLPPGKYEIVAAFQGDRERESNERRYREYLESKKKSNKFQNFPDREKTKDRYREKLPRIERENSFGFLPTVPPPSPQHNRVRDSSPKPDPYLKQYSRYSSPDYPYFTQKEEFNRDRRVPPTSHKTNHKSQNYYQEESHHQSVLPQVQSFDSFMKEKERKKSPVKKVPSSSRFVERPNPYFEDTPRDVNSLPPGKYEIVALKDDYNQHLNNHQNDQHHNHNHHKPEKPNYHHQEEDHRYRNEDAIRYKHSSHVQHHPPPPVNKPPKSYYENPNESPRSVNDLPPGKYEIVDLVTERNSYQTFEEERPKRHDNYYPHEEEEIRRKKKKTDNAPPLRIINNLNYFDENTGKKYTMKYENQTPRPLKEYEKSQQHHTRKQNAPQSFHGFPEEEIRNEEYDYEYYDSEEDVSRYRPKENHPERHRDDYYDRRRPDDEYYETREREPDPLDHHFYEEPPRSKPRRIEQERRPNRAIEDKGARNSGLENLFKIAGGEGVKSSPYDNSGEKISGAKKVVGNPNFKCPEPDGHFGDPDDCARFYQCAHGDARIEVCPGKLFWNRKTNQCDWPENVDCSYTPQTIARFAAEKPTTIFLTFDDGPNEGTDEILDALDATGIKASFFINSKSLHINDDQPEPNTKEKAERNARSLLRAISDGHVIADHSYDHMYHNSPNSPKNAYVNPDKDIKFFGKMNVYPVLDLLWKAGRKDLIGYTNFTMENYVRLPYTNAWRIGGIEKDCFRCTVPASSGQAGISIANSLSLGMGKQVLGWDIEWPINWDYNRFKHGGKEMFFALARDQARLGPKVILLSHDIAHRPQDRRDEGKELETFIRLALDAGFRFDTIDNYLD